ncbi:hypothetical protein AMATHDRAFT_49277 [Amanita thiersii Skay4041]|uniref:DUF6533 domain-containing protein n=1 Tax=Amanita thiersii Skay4041 TaxID=703135 RepID=A0A2A9NLZ2_9AGAR|nr:hypothetical protein AMATHDRAFT_49277 [Amanita thiersii Skay4041]
MINNTPRMFSYLYSFSIAIPQHKMLTNTTQQFFDYLLTLNSEITLIWKSDWGIVKALFLIMRYIPFVDVTPLRIYYQSVPNVSRWSCVLSSHIIPGDSIISLLLTNSNWQCTVSITIGLAATEYLLAIRTWCLWHRRRAAGIVIFSMATGSFISIVVLIVQYLLSIKYAPTQFSTQPRCTTNAVEKLFIVYTILLVFEITLLFATIIAGINIRRFGSLGFTKVIVRDGIFYYIYLGGMLSSDFLLYLMMPIQMHSSVNR